jgi:aryl carrier-like protein
MLVLLQLLKLLSHQGWVDPAMLTAEDLLTLSIDSGGKCLDFAEIKRFVLEEIISRTFVSPADELEQVMEMYWRENLGLPSRISVVSNFFHIGGDSLKAGQLVSCVRKNLGVWLTVAELFNHSSIRELSDLLRTRNVDLDKMKCVL